MYSISVGGHYNTSEVKPVNMIVHGHPWADNDGSNKEVSAEVACYSKHMLLD